MNRYLISLEGKSWEWCKDNFKLMTMEEFKNHGGFKRNDIMFWSNQLMPHKSPFKPPHSNVGHYYLMTDFEPSNIFTNYDYSSYDIRFTPSVQDPLVKTLKVQPGRREPNFTWKYHIIQNNCYIFKGSEGYFLNFLNWQENPLEGK